MNSALMRYYERIILQRPQAALLFVAILFIFFGTQAPNFKLDASAESLVLEDDEPLRYYRVINKRYGSNDFLVITFTPVEDVLSDSSLASLKSLSDELSQIERVESIVNILNVPLLNSPKIKISQLSTNVRTLETPDIDMELVRKEFLESPMSKTCCPTARSRV